VLGWALDLQLALLSDGDDEVGCAAVVLRRVAEAGLVLHAIRSRGETDSELEKVAELEAVVALEKGSQLEEASLRGKVSVSEDA
jgi:hypothetical protein